MSETPRSGDGEPVNPWSQPHQPTWDPAYPPASTPRDGFAPPPGMHPYAMPRKHNDATTSMVLGIVSVSGAFICGLPVVMSPFAWYLGAKAEREIDASGGSLDGRGEATAGKVLGIIGTVLLLLGVAAIAVLIVLTFTVDGFWDDEYGSYDSVLGGLRQALTQSWRR